MVVGTDPRLSDSFPVRRFSGSDGLVVGASDTSGLGEPGIAGALRPVQIMIRNVPIALDVTGEAIDTEP